MYTNKNLANAYFIMGSRLYMKSYPREGCEECRPRSGKDDEGIKGFHCTNT